MAYSFHFCSFLISVKHLIFLNTIQMTRFGNDFDYKLAYRDAWLYAVIMSTISVINLTLVLTSMYSSLDIFLHNLLEAFLTFSIGHIQNQISMAPLLTYIYMMRNLQKRYAVLNQLLRYALYFSENGFYFDFITNICNFFAHGDSRFIHTENVFSME